MNHQDRPHPSTFPSLSLDPLDHAHKAKANIENFIGNVSVPVGIAGPLLWRDAANMTSPEIVYAPIATTEGTLVASTCRGASICNQSGGIVSFVTRRGGIQRAPVFKLDYAVYRDACGPQMLRFAELLNRPDTLEWLRPIAQAKTRHGKLMALQAICTGGFEVHMRLTLDPGAAAGQNMVSIASSLVVEAILDKFSSRAPAEGKFVFERVWMEGGLSNEKTPSPFATLAGRGWGVTAYACIPLTVLEQRTRASIPTLLAHLRTFKAAMHASGSLHSAASPTNIVAAIFLATGQDIACVSESAQSAQTTYELMRNEKGQECLRWEISLPNVVCGVVGGGTGLPSQAEALRIMGVNKVDEGSQRLAQLCASFALANEVSFFCAIAAGEWVKAHEDLKARV